MKDQTREEEGRQSGNEQQAQQLTPRAQRRGRDQRIAGKKIINQCVLMLRHLFYALQLMDYRLFKQLIFDPRKPPFPAAMKERDIGYEADTLF